MTPRDIRITAEEWASGVRHCGNCDGYGFYGVWDGTEYGRTDCDDCNSTGRTTASRPASGEVGEPVAWADARDLAERECFDIIACSNRYKALNPNPLRYDTPLYRSLPGDAVDAALERAAKLIEPSPDDYGDRYEESIGDALGNENFRLRTELAAEIRALKDEAMRGGGSNG